MLSQDGCLKCQLYKQNVKIKKSGLKYSQIKYEHFRARYTIDIDADETKIIKIVPKNKTRKEI